MRLHRKNFTPSDYTRVCSVHFQEGKYWFSSINFSVTIYYDVGEPSSLEDECHPDWAPTLCLGGAPEMESSTLEAAVSRHQRATKREIKRMRIDECSQVTLDYCCGFTVSHTFSLH